MSDASHSGEQGPSQRGVEIGTAVVILIFGAVVIYGAWLAGIGWGAEGPKAGFFPFYVGLAIVISSLVNIAQAFQSDGKTLFADWSQLRQVLAVVIPTAIYVAAIPFIGLYVASIILIAGFMKVLGKYAWGITLGVAIGVPLLAFVMFEKWFLVPLPKGPIEALLGF
jgi:putative tricarboxylic transport membrane protein